MTAGAAKEPVRIAVVGAGLIGQTHIRHVLACPEARLAAIVDPALGIRDQAARLGVPWHGELESLLSGPRPDAIVLATPNRLHAPGALACIAAGIPTLIEKPIADDLESARAIAEASLGAGVPVLVGHHRRHSVTARRARALIASGRLGRIVSVNGLCWFSKPDAYFEAAPWRREPGGGVVLINLIHVIDDLRHLCGEIASIRAVSSHSVRGFPVEDTAAILLRFENGALGTLSISDAAAAPWSWEMTSGENKAYPRTEQACYLIGGTEGSLSVPRLEIWRHEDAGGWFSPIASERIVTPDADPLALQMQQVCAVARREAEPLVDAREATKTLEATLAVLDSARRGGAEVVLTEPV